MRSQANAEGVSPEDGEVYFDYQYSEDPIEQFRRLFIEFEKLPSEILSNRKIVKAFVTPWFKEFRDEIENYDIEETEYFDCRTTLLFHGNKESLYRLPYNIGRLKNVNNAVIVEENLQSLPASIAKFEKLVYFFLSCKEITHLPYPFIKSNKPSFFELVECFKLQIPNRLKTLK